MEAIVSIPGAKSLAVAFPANSNPTVQDLQCRLEEMLHIPMDEQRLLTCGGMPLEYSHEQQDQEQSYADVPLFPTTETLRFLNLSLRMNGGKGGFGSMLRAQGGRMNSQKGPANTEACRDLSGRRIKTVNDAKKMAEYLQQEPEREKAKKESLKRKIEEKLEKADRPTRKHRFEDAKFFDQLEENVEEVKSAVAQAIKESLKPKYMGSSSAGSGSSSGSGSEKESGASSVGSSSSSSKGKGKAVEPVEVKKKVAVKSLSMWDNMSDYESSDEDEEEEKEEEEEEEEIVEEKEEEKPASKSKGKGKASSAPAKSSRAKK